MSEENVRMQIRYPWVVIGTDAGANGYVVPSTVRKFIKNGSISVKALGAVADGKVVKGPNYVPPDVAGVLGRFDPSVEL